jgi:putative glutamine amidotransferase
MKKPIIGLTFDAQKPGGYSEHPWYALRENYCTAIVQGGGVPCPLIHELSLVEEYIALLDGLLVTGGGHDVDPCLYGVQEPHPTVKPDTRRTLFEKAMIEKALQKNIPVLGICGGEQILNVTLGGTLIQHIPDEISNAIEHKQDLRTQGAHLVTIEKGTLLHQLLGTEELSVNSYHHQAVKDPAPGVIVNARTTDGVIEGIEAPAYTFCLGLQWHPEFLINPQEASLFKQFMKATHV